MEWIKVSDRLPEEGIYVITYWEKYQKYSLDYIIDYGKDKLWACVLEDDNANVTHWMELTKPPED